MFVRFAAATLAAFALIACERVSPTSPLDQASFAAGSSTLTGPLAARTRSHTFNITFTKWITEVPNMAGVVGGDVGDGAFVGEILAFSPGADITKIEALYHVEGGIHSFTAHNFITENEVTGTAVIEGVVIDGWLKGRKLNGSYDIISCPEKTGGVCFRGTLHIRAAAER
jgi:hypothetical protein